MALPRESAFLPIVKCSLCGDQIEIANMGEHICEQRTEREAAPAEPLASSSSRSDTRYNYRAPYDSGAAGYSDKYGRMPAPVDTGAANRPFAQPGQITPVSSSSESRSASPRTPNLRPGNAGGSGGGGDYYFSPRIAADYSFAPRPTRQPNGSGPDADPSMFGSSPKPQPFGLMQRLNTMAPGPFDGGNRRRNDYDDRAEARSLMERPATSASHRSFMSNTSGNSGGGEAPKPIAGRKEGYGGFGPPQRDEPDGYGLGRSTTEPVRNIGGPSGGGGGGSGQLEVPPRTPSAPAQPRLQPYVGPDQGRYSSASQGSHSSSESAPPPPGTYTPYRPGQAGSSRGSPERRPPRPRPHQRSDTSSFDKLMDELQSSLDGALASAPSAGPDFAPPATTTATNITAGSRPRQQQQQQQQPPPSGVTAAGGPDGRRPDMDDARGRRYESPERRPKSRGTPAPAGGSSTGTSSRGNCKACGLVITGKSISSADGRLTGRYHKACFVCSQCREPFASAEFYVMNDQPYCHLHYHKLNGSLCGSCRQGIEGKFIEDEALVKYHFSGCFCCADCGRDLSDDYFELSGRAYCERHAVKRVQKANAAARAAAAAARAQVAEEEDEDEDLDEDEVEEDDDEDEEDEQEEEEVVDDEEDDEDEDLSRLAPPMLSTPLSLSPASANKRETIWPEFSIPPQQQQQPRQPRLGRAPTMPVMENGPRMNSRPQAQGPPRGGPPPPNPGITRSQTEAPARNLPAQGLPRGVRGTVLPPPPRRDPRAPPPFLPNGGGNNRLGRFGVPKQIAAQRRMTKIGMMPPVGPGGR